MVPSFIFALSRHGPFSTHHPGLGFCYEMNYDSPQLEALTPNVTVFGQRTCKEIFQVK